MKKNDSKKRKLVSAPISPPIEKRAKYLPRGEFANDAVVENKTTAKYEEINLTHLEKVHAHEKDKFIQFEEKTHTYTIDWGGVHPELDLSRERCAQLGSLQISVSGLYGRYFPKFDEEAVIKRMKSGKNFKKNKKYHCAVSGEALSNKEIKAIWGKNRTRAANAGTALHLEIETYMCSEREPERQKDPGTCMRYFYQFYDDHFKGKGGGYQKYRTEWRLFAPKEYLLAGTPDMVSVSKHFRDFPGNETLLLTLFDWKMSKKVTKFSFTGECGTGLCSDVKATNFFKYSFQQSIYKYLLEKFYSNYEIKWGNKTYKKIKVDAMYLVVLHENNDHYLKIQCVDFTETVQKMFEERRREVSQKLKLRQ